MKSFFFVSAIFIFLTGCSATWNGVQEDTTNAVQWTKGQVNQGATYVKQKTE